MANIRVSPYPNEAYEVGWISAHHIELAAGGLMLDDDHGRPQTPQSTSDINNYRLGQIHEHKVVIGCLPDGEVGPAPAAVVATNMLRSFPNIRIGLMVGIGAGIPNGTGDDEDVRLGDVVISSDKSTGGVIAYNFGNKLSDGSFKVAYHLNQPPQFLRTALSSLKAYHETNDSMMSSYVSQMLKKGVAAKMARWKSPGQAMDLLFPPGYPHQGGKDCQGCDPERAIKRGSSTQGNSIPNIHYGIIATGTEVVKHPPTRDQIKNEHHAICLEMEAAGLMNNFPCIVIRGISDYADSHKNDQWHRYAAGNAAACAKELLFFVHPSEVQNNPKATEILSQLHNIGLQLGDVESQMRHSDNKLSEVLEHTKQTGEETTKGIASLSQDISAGFESGVAGRATILSQIGCFRADFSSADKQQNAQLSTIRNDLEETRAICHTTGAGVDSGLRSITAVIGKSQAESYGSHKDLMGRIQLSIDTTHCFAATGDTRVVYPIHRLRKLVQYNEGHANFGDANRIIEDLKVVILTAKKQTQDSATIDSLERITELLSQNIGVLINDCEPRKRLHGQITQHNHHRITQDLGFGSLAISSNTIWLNRRVSNLKKHAKETNVQEFTATVTFFPHSRTDSMFTATFRQLVRNNRVFTSIHNFQANNILPKDSMVFQLVREGRLDEFEGLLQSGQASLRDHDEFGNSLLFIAFEHLQPHMCQFLVSRNVDVDEFGERQGFVVPILSFTVQGNDSEIQIEELRIINKCRKILLENGADPTIDVEDVGSCFWNVLTHSVAESVTLLLDLSEGFANIHSKNERGETPLLHICNNFDKGFSKSKFSLLLNRGASLLDVDKWGGNCLHLCLSHAGRGDLGYPARESEALIFLITQGADLFAKDYGGRSVSHIVYSRMDQDIDCGSYRRDLWDLVLIASGFNISKVRGDFQRVGKYTTGRYTKTKFRQLWAGRERLCPYPEDLSDEFDQVTTSEDDEDSSGATSSSSDANALSIEDVLHHGQDRAAINDDSENDSNEEEVSENGSNEEEVSEFEYSEQETSSDGDIPFHVYAAGNFCCNRIHFGTHCCQCNWAFGCQDPNCDYCIGNDEESNISTTYRSQNDNSETHETSSIDPDALLSSEQSAPGILASPEDSPQLAGINDNTQNFLYQYWN